MRGAAVAALALALPSALGLGLGAAGCSTGAAGDDADLRAKWLQLTAKKERLEKELSAQTEAILDEPERVSAEVELVVAIPNRFLKQALSRALKDGLDGLSFRIKNLEVHVEEEVKVRILLPEAMLGTVALDVLLEDASGTIRTGEPAVSIGAGMIRGAVAVSVVKGRARARLRFHWTGEALTRPICADLMLVREVEGDLAPFSVDLRGGAAFGVERGEFVLKPALPQTVFRLIIKPSKKSWDQVERAVNAQSDLCRFALQTMDVVSRLRELLEGGIQVTVHTEELKPLRLPLNVKERVSLQDRDLEIKASPALLEIRKRYVWFGSEFEVARVPRSNP